MLRRDRDTDDIQLTRTPVDDGANGIARIQSSGYRKLLAEDDFIGRTRDHITSAFEKNVVEHRTTVLRNRHEAPLRGRIESFQIERRQKPYPRISQRHTGNRLDLLAQ